MSEWNKADELDSDDIDHESEEVDIFVKQNDWGSVYVTLTFDQVDFLYNEIHKND